MPLNKETKPNQTKPNYLFGDKIIQDCLKIDSACKYDDDLLLRQEIKKKRLACPESWYNNK